MKITGAFSCLPKALEVFSKILELPLLGFAPWRELGDAAGQEKAAQECHITQTCQLAARQCNLVHISPLELDNVFAVATGDDHFSMFHKKGMMSHRLGEWP